MTHRQPKRNEPRKRQVREQRRLVIRSVRYRELDAKKFARALIQMATAEAEAQAQAEYEARRTSTENKLPDVLEVQAASSAPKEVA